MRQIRTGLAGLAVVLLVVPSVAQAKNFCISGFPNPNWLLVGKGFVVPGKGSARLGWALTQLIATTLLPMGSGALLRMARICR